MYCAFQYRISSDAFFASSSSIGQNSGQRGSSFSSIAGNSTTSQRSTSSLRSICVTICPVRSSLLHLVITTIIAPPGIRRWIGPDWNHSHAGRNTSGRPSLASCSEWGSSIINRSAPRPARAPPTPMAKYSPPKFVPHLDALFESACSSICGKTSWYGSDPTRFRTLRPNCTAKSAV